jgi:3-hydroxyisobutyrate dehydrogenase-like beta-hydroxyacid dehydrogenase
MLGGDPEPIEQAEAVIAPLGKTTKMGGPGSGQLTKLASQAIYNLNIAAMAEVCPMAQKMGLDPELLIEVLTRGAARSFALESFGPAVLAGEFTKNYPLGAAYKDLVSLSRLSAEKAVPMPLTDALAGVYRAALAEGYGDEDKGALIKVYEKWAKVSFRKKP